MVEGQELSDLTRGPITRGTLALFAGASHDHVLLHIDSDYAKAAGSNDVFAHGMLTMAYLAQALRLWVPPERIRSWKARFISIVPLHATIHCCGVVTEIFEEFGERRARLQISAHTEDRIHALDGEAIVVRD
jgi:acyl dehydratase